MEGSRARRGEYPIRREQRIVQKTNELPTTFTWHDNRYGVDELGLIWREKRCGIGWVEAGAFLEFVPPKEK